MPIQRQNLAKKLNLKSGFKVTTVCAPSHYLNLFDDYPEGIIQVNNPTESSIDFIHLFVKSLEEMKDRFVHLKPMLRKDGMIWISWPKGTSKIATDLKRDVIREFGLLIGLVDVKVCSIDEDWSALKFVYRLKDR